MTKKAVETSKKRYASASLPLMEAILNTLFRFSKEEQALKQLEELRERFILSKEQEDDNLSVRLWISDFSLTEEEIAQGYLGNFAVIRHRKIGDGKFTLYPEKLEIELKNHPQKKRPKRAHPDWGHPILRVIKKKPVFQSVEDAHALLMKLHEEYPEISIPTKNKLYIILYERLKKPPVRKYVLEIKVKEGGGFYIDNAENTYKPKKVPKQEGVLTDEEKVAKGYFTSMVELKKKR